MPWQYPLAPSSGGGGGFAIGSSSIVCETIRTPGYPLDGSVGVPWTQVTLTGTDLSIDGLDPSIIHLATSGWYAWGFSTTFGTSSLPATTTTLQVVWNIPVDSSEQAQIPKQVGPSSNFIAATQLPFAVTAPATLQFACSGAPLAPGDTATLGDGYLCVTRFS